jgi:YD repeat-containing protein
LFIDLK